MFHELRNNKHQKVQPESNRQKRVALAVYKKITLTVRIII